MGRFAAWTLVALCASSCSPSAEPANSPGAGGGGAGGASATGGSAPDATAGTSIDGGRIDEPGDAASMPEADVRDAGISATEAAGSDATVSDAPTPTDGPAARCPAGALLCEDFDKYASAADLAPDWKVTATGGTLAIDATKPFGPTGKALHVTGAAGTPTGVIVREGAPLFPIMLQNSGSSYQAEEYNPLAPPNSMVFFSILRLK